MITGDIIKLGELEAEYKINTGGKNLELFII